MDDNDLAAAAANGDEQAFALLFERYRLLAYAIAYKVLLHEDDALDATQNTFMRVSQKLGQYDRRGSFRGWVATIAANEALTLARNPRRREIATEQVELEELIDRRAGTAATPRERLDAREQHAAVEQSMAALSPQQRAIIALQFREDMRPSEIAERLGLPASQVRTQLCRALEKLRRIVRADTQREKQR